VGGVTVAVTCKNCPGQALDAAYDGVQVTVKITGPHHNAFAGVVGMPTWDVRATATSLTDWIDTATGPAPFIASKKAFEVATGTPIHCTGTADECALEHPVSDTPTEFTEFTWTDFGYDKPCLDTGNVNDSDLQAYLDGIAAFEVTLQVGCYIAQHNNGVMNNIVKWLHDHAPMTFPVPVVDEAGKFVSWATFVMTDATPAGRNGTITGYFRNDAQYAQLNVKSPGFGSATFGGSYRLKLIN
jgi:hypothetical protein